MLPSPAFSAFAAMAGVWGLEVRSYELTRDAGYRLTPKAVTAATDENTVLALVNSPHNPTGAAVARSEIAALAAALGERGVPLIADEVYHPLSFEGAPPVSAAGLDNVIVMGDMSKAMSLPGTRIGWLVVPDPRQRERIVDARSYFTISGSPVMETLATQALLHHEIILSRLRRTATTNLALLSDFMDRMADRLAWVKPAGGTVCFPWFRDGRDSRGFCERLAKAGVLIAPGDCFGVPEHFRVGFGMQEDGFSEALAIFEQVLREQ